MPGADLPSFIVTNICISLCYCTIGFLSLCVLLSLGTIFFALFFSHSILLFNRVIFKSVTVLPLFCCRDTTFIVQSILYCSPQAFAYKQHSTPSHFHSSSQITHNNSHTTASNPTNSIQTKPNFQQKLAVKDQHVFQQKNPRRFGHRCSRQHSSWAYGHGHASPLRQSQQQPSRCRRFKLPMQIHQQHWRNSHKHGYRLPTKALLHRRGYPWRWVMPSLSDHRQPCN